MPELLSVVGLVNPLSLLDAVWPYLLMLAGFSLIVFVHELGHFAVAKWAGVRVERFAIGFGRELFGFTRGETRYSFNLLPLGGYVKMLGQEDFDDKTNELKASDDPRSFLNKPVPHRMAIVSAGVIMNIIFACLVFGVVFMIGMEALGTRIGFVEPDSPAHKAGLLPGDEIVSINGEAVREFRDVLAAVMLSPLHEPIAFEVRRQGEEKRIEVIPDYRRPDTTKEIRRQVVGISPGRTRDIVFVGPEVNAAAANSPKVGDKFVSIAGRPVTDANASEMLDLLAYTNGPFVVERSDPTKPDAAPTKVEVEIPPRLMLFPSERNDQGSMSLLGLTPLVRFDAVEPGRRAFLGGLRSGDTILMCGDIEYPNRLDVVRAIQESPERDIPFRVQRTTGEVVKGFVRPQVNSRGAANIQAACEAVPSAEGAGGAKSRLGAVRRHGIAEQAELNEGDEIVAVGNKQNPSCREWNEVIREGASRAVPVTVRRADGRTYSTSVVPQSPGAIDATFDLAAEDTLQVGRVVKTINGQPSPAAEAGFADGARITQVNEKPVTRWRELIDAFRANAGRTVRLGVKDSSGSETEVAFRVPSSLRTKLGVGPEARILKIDGRETFTPPNATDEYFVGHHEATRSLLAELAGKTVPVEFRRDAFSERETAEVKIDADMVDPWLGRVAYLPTVVVGGEMKLLKGENVFDAVRIGVHKTYYFILQVYEYLNRMIVSRSVSVESMSGPLGIVDTGGKIARAGWVDFLFFLAIISANLAVINFLPLPIVDGGLMVFLIIEWIKGSPVSLKVQVATQTIGIVLIVCTFLFVTYNDVVRLFG